ncbi:ly6/PLAUR domain-containing protein 3-like [Chaetodon trifascialis]|uniref:ly6/PLAUR domain-containing protein 3-like n=1 Tax=Chaetodon trifascialis TaxID=109706 RepID=UPI0039927213
MRLLVLIFGTVLLPQAYPLKCYQCVPGSSGTCTDTETQCHASFYQCGAWRTVTYSGGIEFSHVQVKGCILPGECTESSLNYGLSRSVLTTKCCPYELCNTEPAPEPSTSNPNGKMCYYCDGKDCSGTVNCLGNEDHCISVNVISDGEEKIFKGCASKLLCADPQDRSVTQEEISCCQGDFCNSASSTSAGLLLLVAPLISLVMFS